MFWSLAPRVLLAAAVAASLGFRQTAGSVEKLLADARQALGGDARLDAVKTFTAKGSIRVRAGTGWNYGSFEILCELPDKFIEIASHTYASPGPTASQAPWDSAFLNSGGGGRSTSRRLTKLGFNGPTTIYEPAVWVFANVGVPGKQDHARLIQRMRPRANERFVNLTLGLFATSFAGVPLQFEEANGPDAETAVIVKGDGLEGMLRFNPTTHLPDRIGYLAYEDYRDVDGLKVPFRLTVLNGRTTPGIQRQTAEEWVITDFHFDVPISPKKFR